ncbi:unnamed protein product [Rangifer tarandus platyrhynchus]|uniref:Uncharacterized protein n=1 Tax=Rangifer tarandus platyrhynchus TaxID=3082113 RepID=A0AC59ZP53_RANTA
MGGERGGGNTLGRKGEGAGLGGRDVWLPRSLQSRRGLMWSRWEAWSYRDLLAPAKRRAANPQAGRCTQALQAGTGSPRGSPASASC